MYPYRIIQHKNQAGIMKTPYVCGFRCLVYWAQRRPKEAGRPPFSVQSSSVYSMEDVAMIAERSDFLCNTDNLQRFWEKQVAGAEAFFANLDTDLSWLDPSE